MIRYAAGVAKACALILCLVTLLPLAACSAASASKKTAPPAPKAASAAPSGQIAACWLPLVERLQKDPAVSPAALRYFSALPEYSASPMGAKIKELFTSKFLRKARPAGTGPKLPPSRIYRNVVTAAAVSKCNAFLARNKTVFDAVEKKYPVPREILVSLLFVETRLGAYVGKENAFWSLACMAAADSPEMVKAGIGDIPIKTEHDAWLQARLTDKSGWAYKELRALLNYCSVQRLDPHAMPGSVYGAIGLCQFMPSNLAPYGDDGDGDGVSNLFSEADAVFSTARYLSGHGWKAGASVEARRKVLKRYNNLTIYANTILALGESLRTGVLQAGPPDAPKIKSASAKKPGHGAKKAAPRSGKARKAKSAKEATKSKNT